MSYLWDRCIIAMSYRWDAKSFRTGNAYMRQWTWSSLVRAIACGLWTPNHYLNQWWLSEAKSIDPRVRISFDIWTPGWIYGVCVCICVWVGGTNNAPYRDQDCPECLVITRRAVKSKCWLGFVFVFIFVLFRSDWFPERPRFESCLWPQLVSCGFEITSLWQDSI